MSDHDPATVAELIGDDYARSILTATSDEALSATELSERCDASMPTVSRRLDRLQAAGLVVEQTRPRPDGHHETVYAASLQSVTIRLEDGRLDCDVERTDRTEDPADRLTRLWGDL